MPDGNAFWIVRSGPVSIRVFLWIKFLTYLFPLLIMAEVLIVATNILLQVTPFIMYLSIVTIFCMTPGIIAMGIGLGAAYPDFNSENPAQSVTSFGGLVFMLPGRVPARGEVVSHPDGYEFEITDADPRRVKRLRMTLNGAGDGTRIGQTAAAREAAE